MSATTANAAAQANTAPDEGQAAQEQVVAPQETDAISAPSEVQIPEKFVGKSVLDIIPSYLEAEKTISRLGSEKAQREQEAEALRQRYAELEQRYQQAQAQQSQYQPQYSPQPTQRESDPEQILEQKWMDSPLEAVRESMRALKGEVQSTRQAAQMAAQASATAARWEELKRTNPDAVSLEPEMVLLSQQFSRLVPVEHRNTPQMVDALYWMAKGRNQNKIVAQEVESRTQRTSAIKQEKRAAFSESPRTGAGAGDRDFTSLSLDEMRKALGYSDK